MCILQSTVSKARLTNMAVLSSEHKYIKKINFDETIDKFTEKKAGKMATTMLLSMQKNLKSIFISNIY